MTHDPAPSPDHARTLHSAVAALRRLQRWWITALCTLLLIASITLIRNGWWGLPYHAGEISVWRGPNVPLRPDGTSPLFVMAVVRDGHVSVDRGLEGYPSQGDLWADAAAGKVIVTRCWAVVRDDYRGWFGLTRVRHVWKVIVEQNELPDDVQSRISDAVLAFLNAEGQPEVQRVVSMIRSSRGPAEERLATGYIHNAATIALMAVWLWSLGWVVNMYHGARRRRRAEILAQGCCPQCRYLLAGLGNAATCPECGHTLNRAQCTQS